MDFNGFYAFIMSQAIILDRNFKEKKKNQQNNNGNGKNKSHQAQNTKQYQSNDPDLKDFVQEHKPDVEWAKINQQQRDQHNNTQKKSTEEHKKQKKQQRSANQHQQLDKHSLQSVTSSATSNQT